MDHRFFAVVDFRRAAMKTKLTPILYWTPRILGILFAIFISIFALDVFMEGYGFWETVVALVMHLVPTAIIVIVLLIAWRWERVGGVLFLVFGALYIVMFWEIDGLVAFLLISGSLFLIGALFLFGWHNRRDTRA
jgi:hypothetical protein